MRAYFCRNIAIEMGGISRYFSEVSVSRGRFDSSDKLGPANRTLATPEQQDRNIAGYGATNVLLLTVCLGSMASDRIAFAAFPCSGGSLESPALSLHL